MIRIYMYCQIHKFTSFYFKPLIEHWRCIAFVMLIKRVHVYVHSSLKPPLSTSATCWVVWNLAWPCYGMTGPGVCYGVDYWFSPVLIWILIDMDVVFVSVCVCIADMDSGCGGILCRNNRCNYNNQTVAWMCKHDSVIKCNYILYLILSVSSLIIGQSRLKLIPCMMFYYERDTKELLC